MKKRRKALLVISLIAAICIACYHPFMRAYDDFVDEWADPSYSGPGVWPRYTGGWFEYSVDNGFPCSKLIMIKNSTSRDYNKTVFLYTGANSEASIGGKDYWLVEKVNYGPDVYERVEYYIEWWILNYTIYVGDWTWEYWNGTHWVEEHAWFYEYHDWELVAELSMWDFPWDYPDRNEMFNEQYNITLYADWYGYI